MIQLEYLIDSIKERNIKYKIDEQGCWICTSHKSKTQRDGTKAYYSISDFVTKKIIMIHQMVFRHYYGDYDKGMCLRHKCDNALCINPNHLELGTHQDNMNDLYTRRKEHIVSTRKGSKNGNSKLTDNQVEIIRTRYKSGNTTQEILANEFGVSRQLISKIVNNKNWT